MLILNWQKEWVHNFNAIKNIIEQTLSDFAIKVEHIGSTSIPNLAAKAVIDIDIVYFEEESFIGIKNSLENLGYNHHGDQGIQGREVFKRSQKDTVNPVLDEILHHVYLCHFSNAELQRHLSFRDYLRTHPKEKAAYENLKLHIAVLAKQDSKEYARLKEILAKEFIESIIQKSAK